MTARPIADLPLVDSFVSNLEVAAITAGAAANTRSIAAQAYLYAMPPFLFLRQLTEFLQARKYMNPGEFPAGGWVLVRKTSDPTTTTVMPNVDTLYGANYLLLDQQGPVVLSVPAITDRYFSVAVLDAYLNNFANISPRTYGMQAGAFLFTPPGWQGAIPTGMTDVIECPTGCIVMFQRIYVHTPDEYEMLHKLQDAVKVVPLARWGQAEQAFDPVDLSALEVQGLRAIRDPLEFFKHASSFTERNRGPVEDRGLEGLFQSVGIGPGSVLPEEPTLQAAIRAGAADAQAAINGRLSAGPFRNGWRVPDPNAGRSGPHILSRAVTQIYQFGSFVPEEAMYFFAFKDGADKTLRGSNRYVLRFAPGQLPPLNAPGFWSLTLYNEKGFLVDNPIDRYIIRPDTPGLAYDADGGLTVHIQAGKPAQGPEGNWLPAPEGVFFVALRAYLGKPPVLEGTWFPPAVQQV